MLKPIDVCRVFSQVAYFLNKLCFSYKIAFQGQSRPYIAGGGGQLSPPRNFQIKVFGPIFFNMPEEVFVCLNKVNSR